MSTTIAQLRAVVSAETDEAARKIRDFGQTVATTSRNTEQSIGKIGQVLRGDFTGALVGLGATAGLVTAGVTSAKLAVSFDDMRQKAANVRRELSAYAGGAAAAEAATNAMLRATDSGVSKLDAMRMSSQLLSMGIASSSEQIYSLSRMAVLLGDKTLDVQTRMGNWNAMLANQSLPRLDTFGISSGRVRVRIEELMAATAGMTRETAFTNAVLEIGGEKLKEVEAAGVEAATSLQRLGAAVVNLRQAVAEKIHVQIVVDNVAKDIDNAAYWLTDDGANERRYAEAADSYRRAAEGVASAQAELGKWYANITPLAQANYEHKLQEAQAAENYALAEYRVAEALMNSSSAMGVEDDAARQYLKTMQDSVPAALEYAEALDAEAKSLQRATLARGAYLTQRSKKYLEDREAARLNEGSYGAQMTKWAQPRTVALGPDEVEQWVARMQAGNTKIAGDTKTKMADALTDAARIFNTKMQTALQEGQKFSIGLSDMRPGGAQGLNAPGAGGAFEDIYRLQAFVKDGSWGETAAKYGLDQAGASKRIQDFQTGKWTPDVMQLIDTDKLTQQIQDAQVGQQMMDAVTADLAKAAGADQKVVKALLGLGGSAAGSMPALDLGGQLIPSLTSAIDAELLSKGADLEKRGAVAWERFEAGMLAKAKKSTGFVLMIDEMVANSLANYIPPN